jgi:hypothetical protein
MATQIHIAQAMSQQSKDLQEFMTAMQEHQTNLRLDINRMEVIVGCIAKSSDEEVVKYLPDAKPNHLKSARVPFHTRRALAVIWA